MLANFEVFRLKFTKLSKRSEHQTRNPFMLINLLFLIGWRRIEINRAI